MTGEKLREAATRVRGGWTRGTYGRRRPDGGLEYCVLGALRCAHNNVSFEDALFSAPNDFDAYRRDYEVLKAVLRERFGPDIGHVLFNDNVAKSAEEVAVMLEKAAVRKEELVVQ